MNLKKLTKRIAHRKLLRELSEAKPSDIIIVDENLIYFDLLESFSSSGERGDKK